MSGLLVDTVAEGFAVIKYLIDDMEQHVRTGVNGIIYEYVVSCVNLLSGAADFLIEPLSSASNQFYPPSFQQVYPRQEVLGTRL